MSTQVNKFLQQLDLLAKTNGIEILELSHNPLSGGYKGFIVLEGKKNNLSIKITIDLDFPNEQDSISLRCSPLKSISPKAMERILDSVNEMKNDYIIPTTDEWFDLLSKEIKIRTDFYN